MPITYYDTVNGQLIGETTSGVRTEYLTDALGSVTATVNSSGEIVNTYRYKPYGQLLAKTGSGEDPRYLWTGNTGSRRTLVTYAEQYNQARHYGAKPAGWTTVDPLNNALASVRLFLSARGNKDMVPNYLYCNSNPVSGLDPLGLASTSGGGTDTGNGSGGGGGDSCCSINIPLNSGLCGPSFNVNICRSCYSTCNCSRSCRDVAVGLCYGCSLNIFGSITQVIKDLEDVTAKFMLILNDNTLSCGIGSAEPTCERGCPEAGSSSSARLRASVCLSGISCQLEGPPFEFKCSVGFCGFPSISICLEGDFRYCK